MSTNKTQNYALHSWSPEDDFLRAEFNENFAAIDALLAKKTTVVIGSYHGNSTSEAPAQTVDLGRPILALLVENIRGTRRHSNGSLSYGGLILPGMSTEIPCTITGAAFQVVDAGTTKGSLNSRNTAYIYLAWVEDI